MDRIFHVYMTASKSRVIYVGMTNDLARRVREHKEGGTRSFTKRYKVDRLVWFEDHGRALECDFAREADQGLGPRKEDCAD